MGNANPNDIVAYRKRRKMRGRIFKLLAVLLVLGGIALIWFNANTIFEPLRGIASKIDYKTDDGEGFPVKLPGSASYSFSRFGGSFLLLTDTYLYTYSTSGGQIYALQHGYTHPVQRANDKRILLYDKNSYEFSLYNKTSRIFAEKLSDKIVYAALSSNDLSAVVTTSSRYSNVLYVYNGSGKLRYTRRFVDENVMQAAFTDDEGSIIVSTISVSGGDIVSHVYRLDLSSEGDPVWSCTLPVNAMTYELAVSGQTVSVLSDTCYLTLATSTGEEKGRYPYTGTLLYSCASDGNAALLLRNQTSTMNLLLVLDDNAAVVGSLTVPLNTIQVAIDGDLVYTLEGERLCSHDLALEGTTETSLADEFSAFVKIDGNVYLLGYDTVQMTAIN